MLTGHLYEWRRGPVCVRGEGFWGFRVGQPGLKVLETGRNRPCLRLLSGGPHRGTYTGKYQVPGLLTYRFNRRRVFVFNLSSVSRPLRVVCEGKVSVSYSSMYRWCDEMSLRFGSVVDSNPRG